MAQEQILFDFDKDGPSGWQPSWPVSPDARVYFENMSQVGLFPYKGPNEVFSFDSPNSPTNRAWPVRTVQSGSKCELEFNKNYIFGDGMEGREIWTWFRAANFGGSSVKFTVGGGTSEPRAPVISNVVSTALTQTGATITWTTDSNSDSIVEYGTTTAYGSSASGSGAVKSHSVTLSGLTPGTLYHYRVKSANANGTAVSQDYTFTTSGSGGGGPIAIDGSFDDWSGIPALATGTGTAKSITAASGDGYLYLRLETNTAFNISTTHQIYLDTDNNGATGGNLWPDIGPDYKVIYQTAFNPPQLQRCTGGDTYSGVYTLGAGDKSFSGNYCEIKIPYSAFTTPLTPGQTIKIMYRAGETAAPGFWSSPKNTAYTLN